MIGEEPSLHLELQQLYGPDDDRPDPPDPGFDELMSRVRAEDDAALAELIEADGRLRIRLRRDVGLDRYLRAVPDLGDRPDALDAAIDMVLRWMTRTGRPSPESVEHLVRTYPALETPIRDAAALGNALCSTTRVRTRMVSERRGRPIPSDFGPVLPDDRVRYGLQKLLGEGAFGEVYLAGNRQLSEADHRAMVAIKVLTASDTGAWNRQRLVDEATKARRIDHPNVVRVLDRGVSGEDEDFIVYEYVDGGDLARWMRRRRPLGVDEAVRVAARIARGVHAAHMAGLVHCDLKPANIMVTREGEPKVADFGVAIRTAEQAESREGDQPLGNLAFISPEQYRMEPGALTVPSDLYALGGILYWLLTNHLPNGTSVEAIARAHDPVEGRHAPPSARERRREVDADLDAVCRRAMAIRPERRYASAAAFADDLEAWARREPIPWTRPSAARRLRLWTRRKPALAGAVALIVVLVVGGLAVLQRMSAVAAERRLELAVTAARLEVEEQEREEFIGNLRLFRRNLDEARAERLPTELLPQIWLMEWLFGPTVLSKGDHSTELWPQRIDLVRDLVTRHRAVGRGDDLQTLLWQSALGFWLVCNGEGAEAIEVLTDVDSRWQRLLPEDDPWRYDVRTMRLCATVVTLVAPPTPDTPDAPGRPGDLRAIGDRLDEAAAALAAREPASPLHQLVLRTLDRLYGPELLDDESRRAPVQRQLTAITEDAF
ncbi:MAG: serine/threonine-protein kinase [Planctomycetota bacterium]